MARTKTDEAMPPARRPGAVPPPGSAARRVPRRGRRLRRPRWRRPRWRRPRRCRPSHRRGVRLADGATAAGEVDREGHQRRRRRRPSPSTRGRRSHPPARGLRRCPRAAGGRASRPVRAALIGPRSWRVVVPVPGVLVGRAGVLVLGGGPLLVPVGWSRSCWSRSSGPGAERRGEHPLDLGLQPGVTAAGQRPDLHHRTPGPVRGARARAPRAGAARRGQPHPDPAPGQEQADDEADHGQHGGHEREGPGRVRPDLEGREPGHVRERHAAQPVGQVGALAGLQHESPTALRPPRGPPSMPAVSQLVHRLRQALIAQAQVPRSRR